MFINLLGIFVPNGIESKLMAHRFRKESAASNSSACMRDSWKSNSILWNACYGFSGENNWSFKKTNIHNIYNTKANQNDIIEFHIRPGEWQFPYTLEMLL